MASDTTTISVSGTSISSPLVAGAAALYLESRPTANPADVAGAIVSAATTGRLQSLGSGSPDRLLYTTSLTATPTSSPDTGSTGTTGTGGGTTSGSPTDAAPVASLTASCNKSACTLDASASRDDKGIVTFAWNFGDGTTSAGSTTIVKHSYRATGSFTVTVTATDTMGQSSSARTAVTIRKL
jgi:hypothetical protein